MVEVVEGAHSVRALFGRATVLEMIYIKLAIDRARINLKASNDDNSNKTS